MTVLEACRGATEVTIKYQFQEPQKLKITFPTDGTEDSKNSGKGETEFYVNNGVDYSTRPDEDKTNYSFFGTIIGKSYWTNEDGTNTNLCDKTLYWRLNTTRFGNPKEGEFNIVNNTPVISYPNGHNQAFSPANLVNEECYNDKLYIDSQTDSLDSRFPQTNFEVQDPRIPPIPDTPGCYFMGSPPTPEFYYQEGSIQFDGLFWDKEYFITEASIKNGGKQIIASRDKIPVSSEVIPAELGEENEKTYLKLSETEDIQITENPSYLIIYKRKISDESLTYLDFIYDPGGQQIGVWSHDCSVAECPDDTYQLDCESHYCCYQEDGYAHSRIEKN